MNNGHVNLGATTTSYINSNIVRIALKLNKEIIYSAKTIHQI